MKKITAILFCVVLMAGCKPNGPATTKTTSGALVTMAERTVFVERYVNFRRTYETLDFDIMYQNNGDGMVPAPSDWDIRLVATVPESELPTWLSMGLKPTSAPDTTWLKSVPTRLDLTGVREWYGDEHRMIGFDRQKNLVVYRNSSN